MRSKKKLWHFFLLSQVAVFCLVLFGNCKSEDQSEESESGQAASSEIQPVASRTESTPEVFEVVQNETFIQEPLKTGYVSAICLNVRAADNSNAEILGHVFKGDPLEVYEISGGWYRIGDLAGHVDGWVSGKHISDRFVKSDFTIPEDYKGPHTPTIDNSVTAKYVGVRTCIPCHNKPHAGFAMGPYGVWRDHFHSAAFKTLQTSYSKAFARKRGINDPATDWRCVKCHVTALGVSADRLGPQYNNDEGVGCEACHGPGGDYLHKHYGVNRDDQALAAMGFKIYSNLNERDNMCRACHNELSPTYKPFNVEAFSKAVRHWDSEYIIEVPDDAPSEIVIKAPEPVKEPTVEAVAQSIPEEKRYDQAEYFAKLVKAEAEKPAPTRPVVKQPSPKKTTPLAQAPPPVQQPTGDARLAGIPKDWMLDLNGPRRGPVFFPHIEHFDYVKLEREAEVCIVCHHTGKAGSTPANCSDGACHKFESTIAPSREKAFHANCRTCHREEDAGPQKCRECHNG